MRFLFKLDKSDRSSKLDRIDKLDRLDKSDNRTRFDTIRVHSMFPMQFESMLFISTQITLLYFNSIHLNSIQLSSVDYRLIAPLYVEFLANERLVCNVHVPSYKLSTFPLVSETFAGYAAYRM